MSNPHVLKALQKQRDDLYQSLAGKTLSGLYKQQLNDIRKGRLIYAGWGYPAFRRELIRLSKDTSNDDAFRECVEEIWHLDEAAIVESFTEDITNLLVYIFDNYFEKRLQAIFIEYNNFDSFEGFVSGYGPGVYPLITEPRYLGHEINWLNQVFQGGPAINFHKAWLEYSSIEWTHFTDQYQFRLQTLSQLHSRVLLHQAIQRCYDRGQFGILPLRPFTFYINEHDCELITLFRID